MTDDQRALLNTGLRLIEDPMRLHQLSWIPEKVRRIIDERYKVDERLGREIVMDAIARTGPFADEGQA